MQALPRKCVVRLLSKNQGKCTDAMLARIKSDRSSKLDTLLLPNEGTGVTRICRHPSSTRSAASSGKSRSSQSSIIDPQMP
mmetsp:Transcript_11391/g.26713  ORF Transcript_11391/g.26713 Transcript_11391/m.26713 type:complete len:81 (-) Transcript_11391:235-477(-)